MKYYTIQNGGLLIANNEQALTRFYDNVLPLPEDYEDNKYMNGEGEIEIDVPDYGLVEKEFDEEILEYETIQEEYQEPLVDENLNILLDNEGNIQYETKIKEYQVPIMIEVEEIIQVPSVDEDGDFIYNDGVLVMEDKIITKTVQKSHIEKVTKEVEDIIGYHKETKTIPMLVLNPNFEQIKAHKERERIAKLSLTKREVFLALYKDKGITPEQIKANLSNPEALIEFEYANDYFRGNPLIDTIGITLGYSTEDLDYLFEHKELPSKE